MRVLDWPGGPLDDEFQKDEDKGCWTVAESLPFRKFRHLEELRLISVQEQLLTVGERHELEGRTILIKASIPWDHARSFTSPIIPVKGSTAATLISLRINQSCDSQDIVPHSQIAASIIQTLAQVRDATDKDTELFASLQSLESIGRDRFVSMDCLAQLVHACPSMRSLSIMLDSIKDMPESLKSGQIQELHLGGARLDWLPLFYFVPKLCMSCSIDGNMVPWMKETILALAKSGNRHYRTGVRYLHLHFWDGSAFYYNYSVLAKFILGLVTADAAIKITGDARDVSNQTWIDQLRETISFAREEQRVNQMRRNSKLPPGFRLIENPRDTPLPDYR